jgi:hypothetical protein
MAIDLGWVVTYPTNSDDWLKTVLIGGALTLFSFLVVPAFLVYGYVLRVLRAGMAGEEDLPVFDDWMTLLTEGAVAFVFVLIYQLIPLLVAALTAGGSVAAIGSGSEVGAGAGVAGLLVGLAFSTLLALAFGYVALIGLTNYAHVGAFGAAFDLDVIRSVATDGAYAVPWLYGVGLLIAAAVAASVLGIIPVLGAVAGVFVTFYGQVVAAWVWGKGFGDAIGFGDSTVDDHDRAAADGFD